MFYDQARQKWKSGTFSGNLTVNGTLYAASLSAGILGIIYPVGSIYMETTGVNPGTTWGFGTWVAKGRGQVFVGFKTGDAAFGTVGNTGGATGLAYTPSGTNAISLMREAAAGTNATSAVTGTVSVDWPTGVPTESLVTVSASVTWPTGVPVFAGTAHQHGVPIIHTGTGNVSLHIMPTATWGVAAANQVPTALVTNIGSNVSSTSMVTLAGTTGTGLPMLSQTATAAGAITWPASVPLAVQPTGHSHTITWPASVPAAMAKTLTAAAQIFTGVTASVSGQVFTGVAANLDKMNPYVVVYAWERTA